METIKILNHKDKKAVIKLTQEKCYFLICTINWKQSTWFSWKTYFTKEHAESTAYEFLNS